MKRYAVTALLLSVSFFASSKTLDKVAAVVGEEPILLSDVHAFRKELLSSPALAGIYRLDPNKTSDKFLLEKMIEERIISQSARALDAGVTDVEIENQIANIAKQNKISKSQLEASLVREGITTESYRKNIKAQIERRNVFERELRRSGGGPSDSELRALYDKKAPREYKVSLAAFLAPQTKAALEKRKQEILAVLKKYSSGELNLKQTETTLDASSLGWLGADSLNPIFQKELKGKDKGSFVGPIFSDNKLSVLLIEDVRVGSEEGFQKMKEEVANEMAGQDFERRYQAWLERKKKEMNILINI